jgi:zinc transporter
LVILRGINHRAGSERSDMVALRMWIEAERVISLRVDRMLAPQRVAERVLEGKGPETAATILIEIVRETGDLITPVVDELEDQVDGIEERIVADETRNLRAELAEMRREAISLRRYLGPQRDALQRLGTIDLPGAAPTTRLALLEQADRMTRFVEDLDNVRERAVVASEELASRLSEQINRRMYVLAIVTTIFLPLGLITGLLGINVGGIPGADDARSFAVVAGGIVVLGLIQLWFLKRLRWM